MVSPPGWSEPGQVASFDEYSVVLDGALDLHLHEGTRTVHAGQAVLVRAGERVRYATPAGAEYISVCLPAFAPDALVRDAVPARPPDRNGRRS